MYLISLAGLDNRVRDGAPLPTMGRARPTDVRELIESLETADPEASASAESMMFGSRGVTRQCEFIHHMMIFLKDERWKMRSARRFRCHGEGGGVLDRSLVGLRSRSAAPDNDWAAIRSEPRQRHARARDDVLDKRYK